MNKALEDLQAGRDPFAAKEEDLSAGDKFRTMAQISMWLAFMTGVLMTASWQAVKEADAPTRHTVALIAFYGANVLFGVSIILAIVSLTRVNKYGADGILTRALRTIVVSAIVLSLLWSGFFKGMQARQVLSEFKDSTADVRADLRKESNAKHGVTPEDSLRAADKMRKNMDVAAEKLTGTDALIMQASSGIMGQLQVLMQRYTKAAAPLMDPTFVSMSGVTQPLQLQAKKEAVGKFMSANQDITAYVKNLEKSFEAELDKRNVAGSERTEAMQGFRKGWTPQKEMLLEIRSKDQDMGTALMGMLNLLDANWGHWKNDNGRANFDDPQTQDKYATYLKDMVKAGQEQVRLQKTFFANQTGGG